VALGEIREFRVPDLGEGLEDAQIVEWHVKVGDAVELNQDVCVVETAKALVAIPSPFTGQVVERFGDVGDTVDVGKPLLRIEATESTPEPSSTSKPRPEEAMDEEQTEAKRESVLVGYGADPASRPRRRRAGRGAATTADERSPQSVARPKALAKPPVRKLAKDLEVDLPTLVPGSGPDGAITRGDVEAAARPQIPGSEAATAAVAEGPKPGDRIPLTGIRGRIAKKMVASRTEIPEATCSISVDCTDLVRGAKDLTDAAHGEGVEIKVTSLTLILKASALALRRYPDVNSRIDDSANEIVLLEDVNIGVASDTERGLIVPVIKRANERTTLEMAQELTRLVEAARSGSIVPDDLIGGTFTVNNYGALGTEDGEPIINYPEAAILGVGAIKERPWVVDGELAVRRVGRLTLAFDHRILDGGTAARFLTYVGLLMEHPAHLLLHS
jgi:2-oxoisovalerate dehydrogenase E2 component (dihydrolipoyl transacylase)